MNDITNPLRLAVGSHGAGSGAGCAMNVVSWENGDLTISDLPPCSDPLLAKIVQRVNDTYCTHTEAHNGVSLICPPCSVELLELAHRTVGSALDWPAAKRARLYAEIAVEQAESVLHLTTSEAPRRAVALVRRFLAGGPVTALELTAAARAAAAAAYGVAYGAAYDAAYAAYGAAYAAAAASAADAADAAYGAAAAAAYAAAAAAAGDAYGASRLPRAHAIIDRFEELTGLRSTPVAAEVTAAAVAAMTAASQ